MASKYLASLSKEQYNDLTQKLYNIQSKKCYICCKEINLNLHEKEIDHIIPLANKGKDNENNFALTHLNCNRSKLDADLNIARILFKLKEIQEKTQEEENRAASLKHILSHFGGAKYNFKFQLEKNIIRYSFSEAGDNTIYERPILEDSLSKEKSCFIEVPIEYVFHDELINPRGINTSIRKLIKEFRKGNPQLYFGLSRIDEGKLKIFDGQHKAVAQILLGVKKLVLRFFIDPNLDRLIETNTNAGSTLKQIAFDKSVMRQLNNTLYSEYIKKYQKDHKLNFDDLSFSEKKLIDYFRGDNVSIKKYIIESIKHSITYSKDNKLKDYIDFEGRSKELPISHSAYDKTFLSLFINSKLILETPINFRTDEGLNPRELEISQVINLLNLIANEIYIGKFKPEVGVARIEKKIINEQDLEITDDHLIAYRISKEEIMRNWLIYVKKVIENYFNNMGKIFNNDKLFQEEFDNQLWTNIGNFLKNLKELALWKDRTMANTIFAGKKNYDYWKIIFETGRSPDGAQVLTKPLNFVEMIKSRDFELEK